MWNLIPNNFMLITILNQGRLSKTEGKNECLLSCCNIFSEEMNT
jgi:hypothetical protein